MSDAEVRPGRFRRVVKKVAVGLLVPLGIFALVILGGRAYLSSVGTDRLVALTSQLDAAEPGWKIEGLLTRHREKELPPEQNAAVIVQKVHDLLPHAWRARDGKQPFPTPMPPFTRPDAKKTAAMQAFKEPTAEARSLARTLRGLPNGHIPIADAAAFRTAGWQHTTRLLDVARLLQYDGALAGLAGDADGSIESAHAALNVGRSVGEHPSLMAQLTRGACAKLAANAAQDSLGWGEPARGLAELQAAFVQEADAPRMLHALLGERSWLSDRFTRFDSGELTAAELSDRPLGTKSAAIVGFYRGISQGEHAENLRVLNEAIAAARLPFDQQAAAYAAIRPVTGDWRFSGYPVAGRSAVERYAHDDLRIRVDLLAASAGIACERFRRANGRWPASLGEIPKDILPAVPTDPFDAQSLRVVPQPDGVAVVVADHPPPGSSPRPPANRTAFRLYNPAHRGPDAPPRPPKKTPPPPEKNP